MEIKIVTKTPSKIILSKSKINQNTDIKILLKHYLEHLIQMKSTKNFSRIKEIHKKYLAYALKLNGPIKNNLNKRQYVK